MNAQQPQREIKFRAKAIFDGKWVYGYMASPIHIAIKPLSIELDDDFYAHSYGYDPTGENFHIVGLVEVDPSTVGQYIGLNTKDVTEIYEGDVLLNGRNMYIVYRRETGLWQAQRILKTHIVMGGKPVAHIYYEAEVIGNIYENPELLKSNE